MHTSAPFVLPPPIVPKYNYDKILSRLRIWAWTQIVLSILASIAILAFFVVLPIILIVLAVILVIPVLVLIWIDPQNPFQPIWDNYLFPEPLLCPMLCIVWPTFCVISIFTGIILLRGTRLGKRRYLHLWSIYGVFAIGLFAYQGTIVILNLMTMVNMTTEEDHHGLDKIDIGLIVYCSTFMLLYMYFVVLAQIGCCKISRSKIIPPQPPYNPQYYPEDEQFELLNLNAIGK